MTNYYQTNENNEIIAYTSFASVAEYRGWTLTTEKDIVRGYDGGLYFDGEQPTPPQPTHEEQEEKRAEAYRVEVDPITAHISRLKDIDPQTQEIIAEIEELQTERDGKVAEIKERFPYYDEN